MSISSTLDRLHSQAKRNIWMKCFAAFCSVTLAAGFIPAGIVKLMDERFASGLHANHPMGHYLEALHRTGYYYTFIGVVQIAAAILLLIPRTAALGAFLYFPIILNICILTFATRFDGSFFTAPLMVLANLYVIAWNYEKWKYVLPFNDITEQTIPESVVQTREDANKKNAFFRHPVRFFYERIGSFLRRLLSDKFPLLFFAGVFAAVVFFVFGLRSFYDVMPRNTIEQCRTQFKNGNKTKAGEDFCNCIHTKAETLDKCVLDYNNAPVDDARTP